MLWTLIDAMLGGDAEALLSEVDFDLSSDREADEQETETVPADPAA